MRPKKGKVSRKSWNSSDDSYLFSNYSKNSIRVIAQTLKRTPRAVEARMYRLNKRATVPEKYRPFNPYMLMGVRGVPQKSFDSLDSMNQFLTQNPENRQTPVKVLPKNTVTIVQDN